MSDVSVETAQKFFNEAFAPWLHGLNITVEEIGPERAVLRMAFGEHLCRDGGMICGQALMSLADTAMVFAMIGASGRVRPITSAFTKSMMATCHRLAREGEVSGLPLARRCASRTAGSRRNG